MAAFYRPGAPGDGLGNVSLTKDQVRDQSRLIREATEYAVQFAAEEDGDRNFYIGCSDFRTNKAFFWCIEAARLIAGAGYKDAMRLLRMATKEIAAETRRNPNLLRGF
jgi:hypothetical protein